MAFRVLKSNTCIGEILRCCKFNTFYVARHFFQEEDFALLLKVNQCITESMNSCLHMAQQYMNHAYMDQAPDEHE